MKTVVINLTLLYSVALVPLALSGQTEPPRYRPYIATKKMTVYLAEPGKSEVIKNVIRETEARDSRGRRFSSRGSHIPARFRYEWIRDVVTGRSYEVNRQQRVAYFTALDSLPSGPDASHPGMKAVEIGGVPCVEGPARQVKPDGSTEMIGTTCVSPELGNLLVHDDHRVSIGGENLHIVSELESIQWDTEPPTEWFHVPADYKLVPGHPGQPSSNGRITR
ncbi:MAG: hypothetical protein IT168_08950 [Bryobacterales bacterium]|nr:hypothetical protein [Bryobacterales bacterium]